MESIDTRKFERQKFIQDIEQLNITLQELAKENNAYDDFPVVAFDDYFLIKETNLKDIKIFYSDIEEYWFDKGYSVSTFGLCFTNGKILNLQFYRDELKNVKLCGLFRN